MRFLIAVLDVPNNTGTDTEMSAIDIFNDSLQANGHWIYACGISGPDTATVIDNRDGKGEVSPGPRHSVPEHMSGFWLIEARDMDQALELATRGSLACNRVVEVRAIL